MDEVTQQNAALVEEASLRRSQWRNRLGHCARRLRYSKSCRIDRGGSRLDGRCGLDRRG